MYECSVQVDSASRAVKLSRRLFNAPPTRSLGGVVCGLGALPTTNKRSLVATVETSFKDDLTPIDLEEMQQVHVVDLGKHPLYKKKQSKEEMRRFYGIFNAETGETIPYRDTCPTW